MISRSWFSRSNVRLADGDNAAAPLPLPHPTLAQQCPSCPSPTGRPDSDRLSAVERTDPPVDRSAEMSSSMDGMSEKELLDFLERQVRQLRHYFWHHFSRGYQLHISPRAPCGVLYFVPVQ